MIPTGAIVMVYQQLLIRWALLSLGELILPGTGVKWFTMSSCNTVHLDIVVYIQL